MMKKYTIVVTGAGGFVGANLVEQFVLAGHSVHAIVRPRKTYWRLAQFENNITLHRIGLDSVSTMRRLFTRVKPDLIVHAAAYGSYPKHDDEQAKIDVNIQGTYNLLQAATSVEYKHLIVIGSSSEYGRKNRPMKETDICEPNNFYAATKLAATHLTRVYAIETKKPAVVFRLFNVYGRYEEEGRLVRNMIEAALSGRPMKLATGDEARDFIYAPDIADACLSVMKRKKLHGEVFNIGTGVEKSIKQLAEEVRRLTNSSSKILTHVYPGREWDSTHWKADMRKTARMLQWQPQYALRDGLLETISWYKNEHQHPPPKN